jgi:hypothetical protein
MPEAPIIENIHQKILDAVTNDGTLEMGGWHQDETVDSEGAYCGTTHCRGGWVIALAGKQGVQLESIFGTENAAMQIYKASSKIKVSPVRFYETNEVAMEDIKRCAELEKVQNS